MKHNDLVSQGEDLYLEIGPTLEIHTKGSQERSNIGNMSGEAYADKFNDFNTGGIFGNHRTLQLFTTNNVTCRFLD